MTGAAPVRVGVGYDVHRVATETDRALVLGGVQLSGPGLEGHSDADVVAHAVADALLGAAGLPDLGTLFPDDDPTWKNADSIGLLRAVAARIGEAGFAIGNVDCAVVADAPRLAAHRQAMETNLSAAAGGPVTVKPRRAEGLGPVGRREGIECYAVALLLRREDAR